MSLISQVFSYGIFRVVYITACLHSANRSSFRCYLDGHLETFRHLTTATDNEEDREDLPRIVKINVPLPVVSIVNTVWIPPVR